jgi:hypothetical protein
MAPSHTTSLAENLPESDGRMPESQRVLRVLKPDEPETANTNSILAERKPLLHKAISSNPIEEVVFSMLGDDMVQVVPYDAKLAGYGDFSMSPKEFEELKREFPNMKFTPIKEFSPRINKKIESECKRKKVKTALSGKSKKGKKREAAKQADQPDVPDINNIHAELQALRATVRSLQAQMTNK